LFNYKLMDAGVVFGVCLILVMAFLEPTSVEQNSARSWGHPSGQGEGMMLIRNTPEQELKNRFAQLCVDIIVMAQDLEGDWDKIEPLSADLRAQTEQLGQASEELAATIRLRLSP
jgi:hypothetical protein